MNMKSLFKFHQGLLCIAVFGVMVTLLLIYALKRKYKVNCWFCNENCSVKRGETSWWFCRHCEQFNGFDENGNYSKDIPAMFEDVNVSQQYCQYFPDEENTISKSRSYLCECCQKNQAKKIKTLQDFVPMNEAYFDFECEEYEKYLNKKYAPCHDCSLMVRNQTAAQDRQIKEMYLEQLQKLRPELLRNLKQTHSIGSSGLIGKYLWGLVRFLSPPALVATPLLLKMSLSFSENQEQSMWLNSGALVGIALATYLHKSNVSYCRLRTLSILGWLVLIIVCTVEWQEKIPLVLQMQFLIEVVTIIREVYNHIQKAWKAKNYLKERKRRIEQVKRVQKSPVQKIIQSERSSTSTSPPPSVCSEDIPNDQAEERQSQVTPDLLQGHMNNMFIEKKKHKNPYKESTNHVVAALKYHSNTSSPGSMSKQPLIKPATFTLSENPPFLSTAIRSLSEKKIKYA